MISLFFGDNSFEISRALTEAIDQFEGQPEKIDGSTLELRALPDLLMGVTLFNEKRLVIIKRLSENNVLWTSLADWLSRVSDNIHLVLVEEKPDKRTRTFKDLQKLAATREFKVWGERDTGAAEKWVREEAARLDVTLDKKCAHHLVGRVGVDQWLLHQALQKLSLLDAVTPEVIDDLIEPNPTENIFNLFEVALQGDTGRVKRMLDTLQFTEDPYRLFGLLSSQAFHLLAVTFADKSPGEIAKDLDIHPYALSKLKTYANSRGKTGAKKILAIFVEADNAMKTSAVDPWLLVERALMKVATG